ncbi:zinc dependent phospholipase C family protein [Wukongibacter baidiensis]|uniref:zinc dependent phospholipase C family protein n=1 Tax=Wukongibacter baidiensis TaxID=1723361 RepID=UPI003D7F8C04
MPDFWIHTLGGELVLEGLKDLDWHEMIKNNRKIYNLGCQGPDFFFYNDFLPWVKEKRGPKFGTMIHESHTKALFLQGIDYLKGARTHKDFSTLAIYFLGFMVHYVIDKHEHPFINARTSTTNEHKTFEMKLDTYFIKKYWNKSAHLLSPSSMVDIGHELPSIIVGFYKEMAARVYEASLETGIINDSYNDYKRVFDIFYSPRGYKRFCLNMLNPILPTNISMCIYPTNIDNSFLMEKEFLEFEKLFKEGVSEGIRLIKLVSSYLRDEVGKNSIEDAFYDISFSGRHTL